MIQEKKIPLTDSKEKAAWVAEIIARNFGPSLAKQPKPQKIKGA